MTDFSDLPDLTGLDLQVSIPTYVDPKTWGSIILDLVLQTATDEKIAEAYLIDLPALDALKKHPKFQEEYRKVNDYVNSLGSDAGFILRSRALAEAALPEMGRLVMNKDIHPSVRTKLFNDLVRYANLDPAIAGAKAADNSPKTIVNINMGELMRVKAMPIIDVEPEL